MSKLNPCCLSHLGKQRNAALRNLWFRSSILSPLAITANEARNYFVAGSPTIDFSINVKAGRGPGVMLHAGSPAYFTIANTFNLHGRPGWEGSSQ